MKTKAKAEACTSIVGLVCALVKSKKLLDRPGKDVATILVPQIKKKFPQSKFKLDHVYWYLGQLRWQKAEGLPIDRLVSRHGKRGK